MIEYSKVTPHFHTWAIIICNNMTSFLVKMSFLWGVLVFYFSVFEIEKGCVTLLTKNCSATWANWKNWSCKSWENASASIFFWQWFLLTTGALGYIPLVERREISIFTQNHKVKQWLDLQNHVKMVSEIYYVKNNNYPHHISMSQKVFLKREI